MKSLQTPFKNTRVLLSIGLISLSLIASELVWTRIFSAELFYTFAFLTLSIAVMGLGLGALALRLLPDLLKANTVAALLIFSAVLAAAGPVVVIALGLEFTQLLFSPAMLAMFALAILALGLPYFCAGAALATLFKAHNQHMDRLYMGDMLGAGSGVLLALLAMNLLGTPATVFLVPVPTLLAGALIGSGRLKFAALVLCVVSIGALPWADGLLESPRKERAPVIYKHWDAMAKIKVFDYGEEARGINIDNVANTPVIAFDGDWTVFEEEPVDWDINVGKLVAQFDDATFLSLGAGGGADVLQALGHGANEVHAVEVNPHINRMMLEGDPSGYLPIQGEDSKGSMFETSNVFSGQLYNDPRVRVASEDARTYVRRFPGTFDVIYSLSSNTFAALGSGSFAFAENYLFTVEAFLDYWNALSDEGFLVMEHQFYMPRLVSDVLLALSEIGIGNPADHLAVYRIPNLKRHVMLLSKQALDNDLRQTALGPLNVDGRAMKHLVYPLPDGAENNLINRIVTEGWQSVAGDAEVDVTPTWDDKPFVAQMGLMKNFDLEKLRGVHPIGDVFGFPLSKSILAVIVAIILIIIVPLNLLPYLSKAQWLSAQAWAYFFTIGLAYMIIEIILIQKYTLVIGASIYSIATVLLTLLMASGLGARYARHFGDTFPFVVIVFWTVLLLNMDQVLINATFDVSMPLRALVVALLVTPLGFFMGVPFVKGALRVGQLVDWGFAINGAASVLGASLAIALAFNYGYTKTLLAAAALYVIAGILLGRRTAWR